MNEKIFLKITQEESRFIEGLIRKWLWYHSPKNKSVPIANLIGFKMGFIDE